MILYTGNLFQTNKYPKNLVLTLVRHSRIYNGPEIAHEIVKICKLDTYADNFLVDLGWAGTFRVRILGGGHLQHAHAERINIHTLIVVFLVHLRSHELRCT